MGEFTFAEYKERVLLALGNLSTAHPSVIKNVHGKAVNDAPNDLIRLFPDKFPEFNDNSWTLGPTVAGENKVTMLTSSAPILVLDSLRRPRDEDAATDPAGWEDTNEVIVSHSDVRTIGLLAKGATEVGFPRLYDRKGNFIMYHPTTRAGYESYLRAYGLAGEQRLVSPSSTFRMSADFDEAIVLFAAAKLAVSIQRYARSRELKAEMMEKMTGGFSVTDRESRIDQAVQGFEFGAMGRVL